MEQIHVFENKNQISFSNRKALIQFVSKYVAFLFKSHCEQREATAIDDPQEMLLWEDRIENGVPALEKAVKKVLTTNRYKRNLKLTSKSVFFKEVFKEAKLSSSKNCIPCNVEYEIIGLMFKREVKDRSIA